MTQKFSKFSRHSDSSLKKAPLPPLPFERHIINSSKESQKEGQNASLKLQDALKTIDEYKKKHDEIEKELENIYQNAGLTPRNIQAYLENPNNFSKEEGERMQRERQSLLLSFISEKELEGEERGKKLKTTFLPSESPPQGIKDRRKTKGTRRNWISMR